MNLHYPICINGLSRNLPIVEVAPGISIAFLKLYGDPELVEAAADGLASKLASTVDMIVGPESGGILLSHLLSHKTGIPYALARKKHRPNMTNPEVVELTSIGTTGEQQLFIDDADKARLNGKHVALVDEVISSGATIHALSALVARCGANVVQKIAIATEGNEDPSVTRLLHFPLFVAS